MSEIQTIIT